MTAQSDDFSSDDLVSEISGIEDSGQGPELTNEDNSQVQPEAEQQSPQQIADNPAWKPYLDKFDPALHNQVKEVLHDLDTRTQRRLERDAELRRNYGAFAANGLSYVIRRLAQGFIPPEEGLKFLDLGGVKKIVDNLEQDSRAAMRENLKLAHITEQDIAQFQQEWQMQQGEATIDEETGQPLDPPTIVPVNTWDNHEMHIQVHNQYRKSQAYELLPMAVKKEFERHVQTHQQVMLQETMQSMMDQLPSDGTDMQDGGFDPATMGQDPEMPLDQIGPTMAGGQMGGDQMPIPGLENMGG